MEPQLHRRTTLPLWLRANAICQLILAIAPFTTLILLVLMRYFPDDTWRRDPFVSFFWWWLLFLPFVVGPALIVPFAMATILSSSISPSSACTFECWKSFFGTALYITWLLTDPRWWRFTVMGAILLIVFFYPALIYTWKVWYHAEIEENMRGILGGESNGTSEPRERSRGDGERNGQRRSDGENSGGATENSPLLERNNS